jgi:hypothetical protein
MLKTTHRPVYRVFASVALAITMALLPVTASVARAEPGGRGTLAVPISGTATAADGTTQAVTGTFTVQRFSRSHGQIFAEGTVVGTIASSVAGTAARTFVTQISLPLQLPSAPTMVTSGAVTALASCDILNLVLGPLDLNLLGLTVHLNQVILNIVAVTGAGNLLGNLLCAITGLLDGSSLGNLTALLNGLLALLG